MLNDLTGECMYEIYCAVSFTINLADVKMVMYRLNSLLLWRLELHFDGLQHLYFNVLKIQYNLTVNQATITQAITKMSADTRAALVGS